MAQMTKTGTDIDIEERIKIRYGSRVVLEHVNTHYRLHSHHLYYPTGSKQQQVTCFSGQDSNDYWVVKPSHGDKHSLKLWQQEVTNGAIIQLQHWNTGCYLHSHADVKSAVTQQGEVTCYWGRDTNNNWKIQFKNEGVKGWLRGNKINLIHCNTNCTLHSHNNQYPDWGHKQQEVTAYKARDTNDDWFVSKVEKHEWF
eukprot:173769_1